MTNTPTMPAAGPILDVYRNADHEPEEDDELEEDDSCDCHGWFEDGSKRFVCGAVGSEDCDCCPYYDWLGLTSDEIDMLSDQPTVSP